MGADQILGDVQEAVTFPTMSAIYIWGYNQRGQTARECNEGHLRIPKRLSRELFKCPRGEKLRWLDIACGREHTAAVASDGTLFTWGLSFSMLLLISEISFLEVYFFRA